MLEFKRPLLLPLSPGAVNAWVRLRRKRSIKTADKKIDLFTPMNRARRVSDSNIIWVF